jgi:hypothetical protein
LEWRVITSSVDHAHGTMSTLYGNDAAVDYARTLPQTPYPAGAILALVTWNQQEDKHWFGGRIPGQVQSVEFVNFVAPAPNQTGTAYESWQGSPLQKAAPDPATASSRIAAIMALKAAVMP